MPERLEPPDRPSPPERPVAPREAVQRWRLVLHRAPLGGEPAQREQLAAWEACLSGSGLPVAGLDTPSGRAKLAVAAPLSASIAGEAELVDIWLTERFQRWRVRESLEPRLPPAHRLVDAMDVWLGEPPLPGQVVASVYRATVGADDVDRARLGRAVAELLEATSLPRQRRKGDGTVAYDLRPFVDDLRLDDHPSGAIEVRMTLRHDPEKGVGRPEELLAALGDRLGGALPVRELVRERLVLSRERAAAPAAPGTARRPTPGASPTRSGVR